MQIVSGGGKLARPGRSLEIWAKPSMLYLSTGGVAGAGPRRGSLGRAVRALRGQPAAAVRVAEALAVLFADLREQNGHSGQDVYQSGTRNLERQRSLPFVCAVLRNSGDETHV